MLFKSNKFFNLKSRKNISETIYPKIDITENMCDHTLEYWQLSIYVNFSVFFCMLQVKAIIFLDLTTWKCVISLCTYIYVKFRYLISQEVPFLEFHIPSFVTDISFYFF